jgi:hypothetical protein
LYVPAAPVGTEPEAARPPLSGAVRVAIAVLHVVSPGPYRVKVTVPVGLNPPETVAESDTLPPAGTEPDGVVVIVGEPRTHVTVAVVEIVPATLVTEACTVSVPVTALE